MTSQPRNDDELLLKGHIYRLLGDICLTIAKHYEGKPFDPKFLEGEYYDIKLQMEILKEGRG